MARLTMAGLLLAAVLLGRLPGSASAQTRSAPGAAEIPRAASSAGNTRSPGQENASDTSQITNGLLNLLLNRNGGSPERVTIPLTQPPSAANIQLSNRNGLISLIVRDAPLRDVLTALAQSHELNVVCAENVNATLSISLQNVPLEDALTSIVSVAGATWARSRGIIHVTSLSSTTNLSSDVQGRILRVFQLDYAAAADLELAISGMLSPVGSSHVINSSSTDNRRTADKVVVEDLPAYVDRVEQYITQVDQPPRQVSIEVHVLEVELEDDDRCGVDFEHFMSFADKSVSFGMGGMAGPTSPQAFLVELDGGNLNAMLEALRITTDAKTLASPHVLVVNGQQARIQIGEQLGFRVTTTTETSSLESVDFLDVGVVLEVTPRISRDGRVLLRVRPEVSSGQVNPETGLPEEETTEIETDVLLHDGQAMVIGGLIQESDSDVQTKLKYFGSMYLIGKLFQKNLIVKRRSEIIIALVPRIVPYGPRHEMRVETELQRAQTPLLHGPLDRFPRPWEPRLPHPITNPTMYRLPRVDGLMPRRCLIGCPGCEVCQPPPAPVEHAPPPRNQLGAPEELPPAYDPASASQSSRRAPWQANSRGGRSAAARPTLWRLPQLNAPLLGDSRNTDNAQRARYTPPQKQQKPARIATPPAPFKWR